MPIGPTGTEQSTSTPPHQYGGREHRRLAPARARLRKLLNSRSTYTRSLARTAGQSVVRGAATTLGASAAGWIIWWIQQR